MRGAPLGRWFGMVLIAIVASAAVGAASQAQTPQLGEAQARLLLTRAAFAPLHSEVASIAGLAPAQAVERLLAPEATTLHLPLPAWTGEPLLAPAQRRGQSEEQRRAWRREQRDRLLELRTWWLQQMRTSDAPLAERMTLFWHNHFVTAAPKVRDAQLHARQHLLIRRHAMGSFATLLHEMMRDPAMLVYLDAPGSRRDQPNENLARELMELFTLGEGHYSERDVKEAARALTGWAIDPVSGEPTFRRGRHDDGEKVIFGQRGRHDGTQLVRLLLAHEGTARHIVSRLWVEFVSPRPDPQRIGPIAAKFRASGYDIRTALRALLLQPEVLERTADNALIKSPVELIIGFARQAEVELSGELPAAAAAAAAAMGQGLFAAPNVRGWPGGEHWITTQSLLLRKQFLLLALGGGRAGPMPAASMSGMDDDDPAEPPRRRQRAPAAPAIDQRVWLARLGGLHPERPLSESAQRQLASRLLVLAPAAEPVDAVLAQDALRAVLLDPVYQLR
jgi:uncharacterized protein (DUF1800 family)